MTVFEITRLIIIQDVGTMGLRNDFVSNYVTQLFTGGPDTDEFIP